MTSPNCKETSPKVIKMFEAYAQLMEEGVDLHELKVADITSKAGIGKGTAYEYFKTKEELIFAAQLYYFNQHFLSMQKKIKEAKTFMEAIDVMCITIDRVLENHTGMEIVLRHAISNIDQGLCKKEEGECICDALEPSGENMVTIMLHLSELAIREGVVTQTNLEMISNVIVTQMVGYGIACSMWMKHPKANETIQDCRQRNKEFVKHAIVKLLT